jgi:hypothetical protein
MAFPTRDAFLKSLLPVPELEGQLEVQESQSTPCSICLQPFTDAVRTRCNQSDNHHTFCRADLLQWLEHSNDCPNCRFVFFPPTRPANPPLYVLAELPEIPAFLLEQLNHDLDDDLDRDFEILRLLESLPRSGPAVFGPPRPPAMQRVVLGEVLFAELLRMVLELARPEERLEIEGVMREVWAGVYDEFVNNVD